MNAPFMATRYCAVSVDVTAEIDANYVTANIRTDTGKNITLICENDRIPAIRRRIESLQHAFPGMIARASIAGIATYHDSRPARHEPALAKSPAPSQASTS